MGRMHVTWCVMVGLAGPLALASCVDEPTGTPSQVASDVDTVRSTPGDDDPPLATGDDGAAWCKLPPTSAVVVHELQLGESPWLELFNASDASIDLAGWTLETAGGSHTLDADHAAGGTWTLELPAGGYLVVARGGDGAAPYVAGEDLELGASGGHIALRDETSSLVDEVAWTSEGWGLSGADVSLALVNPWLDNAETASWLEAPPSPMSPNVAAFEPFAEPACPLPVDAGPCAYGACDPDGSCIIGWLPGCCVVEADCDDADPCNADQCLEGACLHSPAIVEGCGGDDGDLDSPPGGCGGEDDDCDGVDDDCDGATDEHFAPTASGCGQGACASVGIVSCVKGQHVDSCRANEAGADEDAICDGIDEDCDGETDEDVPGTETTCGTGACEAVGVIGCLGGESGSSCTPGEPTADDDCDGVDDDCDGQTDEHFLPSAVTCGIGACAATGTTLCVAGEVVDDCAAGEPTDDDDCDGVDDDCDGAADEHCEPSDVTCGIGACAATGETTCVDGETVAACTPGQPTDDDDCDGVDDDCDGADDEHFLPAAVACGIGACAATAVVMCVDGAAVDDCQPGAPDVDDDCDGVDDDCDGLTDEHFEGAATTCGVGACSAAGSWVCVDGGLVEACTPGAPLDSDSACDGVDDDCDGLTY